ncbi:MAG: hypothetical protein HC887_09600 [Desulfobacteraceae bacterium]|nr:hypothetical protein [Desulfobacteraceae bacterium]
MDVVQGADSIAVRLDLSVSSKAYESGMMAFSDMIESFMLLFESRLSTERKKADLGQAIAAIEETIGGSSRQ